MTMTITQQIITVAVVVLGTMTTRFLPFLIFPEGKEPPAIFSIHYLMSYHHYNFLRIPITRISSAPVPYKAPYRRLY